MQGGLEEMDKLLKSSDPDNRGGEGSTLETSWGISGQGSERSQTVGFSTALFGGGMETSMIDGQGKTWTGELRRITNTLQKRLKKNGRLTARMISTTDDFIMEGATCGG